MRNTLGHFLASATFAVVVGMTMSGCGCEGFPIVEDFFNNGPDGWGTCESDGDCFEGCACIDGRCIETGWCFDAGDCSSGTCDESRNTCMPGGPGGGGPGACDDGLCPEGCWFDQLTALCVETDICAADSDCMEGEACQIERSTCVPEARVCGTPAPAPGQCEDDICPEGTYWDPIDGGCIATAVCSMSGDPTCFSDETCDVAEGTCIPNDRECTVPKTSPTPPQCTFSVDCPVGAECVEGVCAIPAPPPPANPGDPEACTFNYHCGSDGTCIDGRCHANCTDDAGCPIGQICDNGGVCIDNPMPTPECATNTECAADEYCINATCFPGCVGDSECGNNEFCKRNVCRPDFRARNECLFNSECDTGEECVDGICRLRCWGDSDCAPLGTESYCDVAWCIFPDEVTSDCNAANPCADGSACVNGHCGG